MSVHHEGGERAQEPRLPPNTAFGFAPFPVRPRREHGGEDPAAGPDADDADEAEAHDEAASPPETRGR